MTTTVSVEDKKNFISWFLSNHELKSYGACQFLQLIMRNKEALEKVHFVEDAHLTPLGMVISSSNSEGIPFRFYSGNMMTATVDKALDALKKCKSDDLYIELCFPAALKKLHLSVLEENPFIKEDVSLLNESDKVFAKKFIDHTLIDMPRTILLAKIDESLDTRNKEMFLALTEQLQKR